MEPDNLKSSGIRILFEYGFMLLMYICKSYLLTMTVKNYSHFKKQ